MEWSSVATVVGTRREEKPYTYVMALQGQNLELSAVSPPAELLQILANFSRLLGYEWDSLPLVLYTQYDEGKWHRLPGPTEPIPFSVPLPRVLDDTELTEHEYHRLGHELVSAYVVMQDRVAKIKTYSRRWDDTEQKKQQMIDELMPHMRRIETTVEDTEWADIFYHKYQRLEKQWIAARELNIAPRTLNRHVRQMLIHMARILYSTLSEKELQAILRFACEKV